jgi:hypothetical protein
MTSELYTENDSARGFAFEYFSAYLLGLAFRTPTRLSEVFNFIGLNNISDQLAQLVAVYKVDENFITTPVDICSNRGPGYTLGHCCRTESETLSWFLDPQRTVFCFPYKTIGPDFVILLRLSDGRLLRVLVQCKHESKNSLGPTGTFDALRTTDPSMFIVHRDKKVPKGHKQGPPREKTIEEMSKRYYVANPQMNGDLQAALNALGPGTDLAGDMSVLRVLISHPASPHLETILNIVKADKSNHPVAIVDVKSLAEKQSMLGAVVRLEESLHVTFNRFTLKRGVDEAYDETAAPVGESRRRRLDTKGA